MNNPSTVQPEWFRSLRDPVFPATEYESLVDRHDSSTPYNRLAWLQGAELAADNGQVETLVLRRAGQMVACIPVIWDRRGLPGRLGFRIARHLGAPLSDRIGLMIEDNDPVLVSLALRMIQNRRAISFIELNELYDGGGGTALTSQFARSYSLATHEHPTCQVPVFELPDERPTEMDLPQRLRTDIRRKRRLSADAGALIRRITPSDGTAWLDQIIAVERASWKGSEGVGIFSAVDHERWMKSALAGLAASGRIRIVALMLDGQIISYRLGLLEKGRLYDYNCAFIPKHSKIASGRLLVDELVQWGADEGWSAIDASRISRATDRHLLHERMNTTVQQYRVRYFSKRPSGFIAYIAQSIWERSKPTWFRFRNRRQKGHGPAQAKSQATVQA